jgi:hypothetical protein
MVVKLAFTGLLRVYKLLFAYLVLDLLSSLGALTIPVDTKRYGDFYFSVQTVRILVAGLVVMEIYSLALANTPALARFGRTTVGYMLGASAAIPAIALLMDNTRSATSYPYLRLYYLFEQTMNGTISIFLILISLFIGWFPVRLRSNVIVYIGGFIVWTLTRAASVHLATLFPQSVVAIRIISSIHMSVAAGCLLFWLVMFRREGEARTAVVGHLWNREEAERLSRQLDVINDNLTRLRRR